MVALAVRDDWVLVTGQIAVPPSAAVQAVPAPSVNPAGMKPSTRRAGTAAQEATTTFETLRAVVGAASPSG